MTAGPPPASASPDDAPADARPTGRRELRKQQTRDDLYDAALALFSERPYDAVSVEDICERAEVGRATFFRFYGTKSGLLVEFHRRLADEARLVVAEAAPATATEALRVVQATMAAAWRSGGPVLRDMAREYIRTVTLAAGSVMSQADVIELVTEIVADGQAQGEFRATLSPDFVAWTIVTTLSGAAVRWGRDDRDGPDFDQSMHDALDLIVRGMAVPG